MPKPSISCPSGTHCSVSVGALQKGYSFARLLKPDGGLQGLEAWVIPDAAERIIIIDPIETGTVTSLQRFIQQIETGFDVARKYQNQGHLAASKDRYIQKLRRHFDDPPTSGKGFDPVDPGQISVRLSAAGPGGVRWRRARDKPALPLYRLVIALMATCLLLSIDSKLGAQTNIYASDGNVAGLVDSQFEIKCGRVHL